MIQGALHAITITITITKRENLKSEMRTGHEPGAELSGGSELQISRVGAEVSPGWLGQANCRFGPSGRLPRAELFLRTRLRKPLFQ
jgi:hypothetical protein